MNTHRSWCLLVQQLLAQPHIMRPEEPLQNYTVGELRAWVTRRHQIQRGLKSLRAPTLRRRTLDTTSKVSDLTMVPGGRWLLFSDISGNLNVVDCEADLLEPTVLLECVWEDLTKDGFTLTTSTWVNPAEPRLTLIIALKWSKISPGSGQYFNLRDLVSCLILYTDHSGAH